MKQLHEYPTPETDADEFSYRIKDDPTLIVESDFARNLERRLAMCQATLRKIAAFNDPVTPECKNPTMKPTRQWAQETLASTTP